MIKYYEQIKNKKKFIFCEFYFSYPSQKNTKCLILSVPIPIFFFYTFVNRREYKLLSSVTFVLLVGFGIIAKKIFFSFLVPYRWPLRTKCVGSAKKSFSGGYTFLRPDLFISEDPLEILFFFPCGVVPMIYAKCRVF